MPEQPSSSLTAPVSQGDVDRYLDLYGGLAVPRCMQAIGDFGIADALGDAPATPAELAGKLGLNADALARMLRYVAVHGIFEDLGGRFRHNALSRLLRRDHPQSRTAHVRVIKLVWQLFGALDHSLLTGHSAAEALAPAGLWELLKANPDLGIRFDEAMVSIARANVAALLKAYDFSNFRSIADIGGGQGHLLRAVIETVPGAEGTLFDRPTVIDPMRRRAADRLSFVAGDFFEDPLPRCDAYLLMSVIHDWDDEKSVSILRNVREAAAARGKLLLIERLLPEKLQPGYLSYLDMGMLAVTGGRERKRTEYEQLLNAAGWRLERVIPTETEIAILEAVAA